MKRANSSVAGILDAQGGLRVVVAKRKTYRHHVIDGEKLFIVPGLKVVEPVEWDRIPYVIKRVEIYIAEWIRTRNDPDALNTRAVSAYIRRCAEQAQT